MTTVSLIALALAGSACVSGPPAAGEATGTPTRDAVTVRTAGLSPEQVDRLRAALVDARGTLPGGAVAGLWVPGKGSWVGAVGQADLRTGRRMRPGLQLPVGSVTKTLTGTIVLQEVNRGRLSLADPMSKWFPRFPKARQITIAMLLNMTSGIADYLNGNFATITKRQRQDPKRIWQPRWMIRVAKRMPRTFPVAGSQFSYSNSNTVILGKILERVTGHPYPKLLARRVLEPVGMRRSFLNLTGGLWAPYAQTYSTLYGQVHGAPRLLRTTGFSLSPEWAAGGLASTLRDMRRWAKALGTGQGVLRGGAQRHRTSQCVAMASDTVTSLEYCLGVAVTRSVADGTVLAYWHNGAVLGATSYVAYYPRTGAVLVVQANQDAETGPHDRTIPDSMAASVTSAVPELLGW